MKKITLIDYTDVFDEKFRENTVIELNNKNDDDQLIPMIEKDEEKNDIEHKKIRTVERIDKLLEKIDVDIRELRIIVDESLDFESDIDDLMKRFKIYSDQINILANSLLKIIKTYEKTEPLVYRQYIVLLQERLKFAETIGSKFKEHHICLRKNNNTIKVNKKNNYDVVMDQDNVSEHNADNHNVGHSNENQQLLEQQMIMRTHHLANIVEERAELIDNIASSISELHQQFVDLQTLVAVQGEMIDHINDNMITSLKYTQEGAKELDIAKKHDDTYTKIKRKIYGGIIGAGVSATVVLGTLKGFNLWGRT